MIYVAARQTYSERVGLEEISEAIASPKAFTGKILQQLSRAGLLESVRGRSGGFTLSKKRKIVLADVVRVIDGEKLLKGCVLGFRACSESRPCPVHHKYKEVRAHLAETLMGVSLGELKTVMDTQGAYFSSS
jgi:Rrf2 family iron-sulfur cluster assembly transcriptional regulator